jgi:hypothetical protein
MVKKIKVLVVLLVLAVAGCATPYVEDPRILGENPATLVLSKESLKKNNSGPVVASLYQRDVTCRGVGRAKASFTSLGEIYTSAKQRKRKLEPTLARPERFLIPAGKKITVIAHHTIPPAPFAAAAYCDVALEFQPKPGAKYFYTTENDIDSVMAGIGRCDADIQELVEDADGVEKAVPTETSPAPYVSGLGFDTRFYCDDKGNVLTGDEWDELKKAERARAGSATEK